ncbi:expressed unknown protein [Ectocarpus siliculosus]|uniref:Uncharacterized protein n=1 Tax=Ectocarpus siliculosus TaxID=2880 RepID=D7G1X3_ECTSI|nr:expressed unknown protein [Ectocarpus siliculosus]|eukprot:CBJ48699.1 expressed unknown protein [Ectocarpus siliculosus]
MQCSIEGCTKTRFFQSAQADGGSFKQAKNVEKAESVLLFCCVFARRVPALSWFRNKRFPLAR